MAPDGSEVRLLSACEQGSMAHFTLPPGAVSKAVLHRTVTELWYILSGEGRMWFASPDGQTQFDLKPGLSFEIPVGTCFQFRTHGNLPLQAVAATMPPWPGDGEAEVVEGVWSPTA